MSEAEEVTATVVAISIHRPSECPILSDEAIRIELVDECGGAFFAISNNGNAEHPLRASLHELRALADAGARLLNQPGVKS